MSGVGLQKNVPKKKDFQLKLQRNFGKKLEKSCSVCSLTHNVQVLPCLLGHLKNNSSTFIQN